MLDVIVFLFWLLALGSLGWYVLGPIFVYMIRLFIKD